MAERSTGPVPPHNPLKGRIVGAFGAPVTVRKHPSRLADAAGGYATVVGSCRTVHALPPDSGSSGCHL
jgi:hypothetical protein